MPLAPGDKLGPYEILSPIGAGGMGEVYKARDARLDRSVAIKVLPEHIAQREDARARFEREARSVASLNHPHICVVHDTGPNYMVMEMIEGETLAARIEKGPIPLNQALTFATQIADALDRAHRAGVTHRDIKPQNIMLTRDGVKVLDFGLAKSAANKPGPSETTLTNVLTTEGSVIGTPQYMAPEQFEGKEADARCDIWAFGAVLYEMVTGRKAFLGKNYTRRTRSHGGAAVHSVMARTPGKTVLAEGPRRPLADNARRGARVADAAAGAAGHRSEIEPLAVGGGCLDGSNGGCFGGMDLDAARGCTPSPADGIRDSSSWPGRVHRRLPRWNDHCLEQ
jgi:serine/threonine protein kinase